MISIGYIIGEAPAKPCKKDGHCMGHFMKAVCKHAGIPQLDYLKLGRLNLHDRPEKLKPGPLIDAAAATRKMGMIIRESILLGADNTYILSMGARANSAMKVAAEASAHGHGSISCDPSGTWMDALKAGTIRTTTIHTSVNLIKPWRVTIRMAYLPHPSGLSRAWNDSVVLATAGRAGHKGDRRQHPRHCGSTRVS